jgi:hypothetical protein
VSHRETRASNKGSFPEEIFPFSRAAARLSAAALQLLSPMPPSVGNLGKALFHFRKLYLGQIFNGQELIAGSFAPRISSSNLS